MTIRTNSIKILGITITGIATVATIAAAILQPEETRSCITFDRSNCPFLKVLAAPNIASEVGADYELLTKLLQNKKYREANEETGRIVLWLVNRQKKGYIDGGSLKRLPCKDMQTIDKLWSKNSNGRFGFKVQKEIWDNILFDNYSVEKSKTFGKEIGWIENDIWLNSPDELTFQLNAPRGHLPARYGKGKMTDGWIVYAILYNKIPSCDF